MNTTKLEMPSVQKLNRMMQSSGYHVVNTEKLAQAGNEENYTPSALDTISARKFITDLIINVPSIFHDLPEVVQADRAVCIDIVSVRPELLRLYDISIRDDSTVIEACLKSKANKQHAVFWSHVSPRLRQRKWIRDLAFSWSPFVFEHFTPTQRNNDSIGRKAFNHSPKLFFHLSETLQNNWEIVSSYLQQEDKTLDYLNINGYSEELISKVGTASTTEKSIGLLYLFGIAKNINAPLGKIQKI